jgi:hypothetical protein
MIGAAVVAQQTVNQSISFLGIMTGKEGFRFGLIWRNPNRVEKDTAQERYIADHR